MSDSKTYHGVTQAIFDCVKQTSEKEHGTVYTPDGNKGTSTTSGTGWEVKMDFDFNPASGDLYYKITHKTWIVPVASVWDGIESTINGCRKKAA